MWRDANNRLHASSRDKVQQLRSTLDTQKAGFDKEIADVRAQLAAAESEKSTGSGELQNLQARLTKAESDVNAHRTKGKSLHNELVRHRYTSIALFAR
jgi:chromosome segregation ATPase